ncbi:hypothetical protein [Phenylobacterium sp.]|uniref:hypothetical protein n=1 Tax=Phenylobacterium sp. TaxID=1871053 RepID=UPI002EDB0087
MRKTLTAMLVVLAAGSLAACKMPWDKEKEPTPGPVATSPDTPAPDTTASTDPAKTVEPTASTDPAKPVTPEATQTPSKPATK